MVDKVMVTPRHIMWKALPASLVDTNNILKDMGRKPLKTAYVAIVPDARFYTYRYQIGAVVPIRVVGTGRRSNGNGELINSLVCSGHRKLVSKVRKVPMEMNRDNRGQLEYEQDKEFLDRAQRSAFREIIGWEHINNRNSDTLAGCKMDVKMCAPFSLYGEIVWIPRKSYDLDLDDLSDDVLTPNYCSRRQAFYVPDYGVPPEVKARARINRERAALPPLPDADPCPALSQSSGEALTEALNDISPLMIKWSRTFPYSPKVDKGRIRNVLLDELGLDIDVRRITLPNHVSIDKPINYWYSLDYGVHTVEVWLSPGESAKFSVHVHA